MGRPPLPWALRAALQEPRDPSQRPAPATAYWSHWPHSPLREHAAQQPSRPGPARPGPGGWEVTQGWVQLTGTGNNLGDSGLVAGRNQSTLQRRWGGSAPFPVTCPVHLARPEGPRASLHYKHAAVGGMTVCSGQARLSGPSTFRKEGDSVRLPRKCRGRLGAQGRAYPGSRGGGSGGQTHPSSARTGSRVGPC